MNLLTVSRLRQYTVKLLTVSHLTQYTVNLLTVSHLRQYTVNLLTVFHLRQYTVHLLSLVSLCLVQQWTCLIQFVMSYSFIQDSFVCCLLCVCYVSVVYCVSVVCVCCLLSVVCLVVYCVSTCLYECVYTCQCTKHLSLISRFYNTALWRVYSSLSRHSFSWWGPSIWLIKKQLC